MKFRLLLSYTFLSLILVIGVIPNSVAIKYEIGVDDGDEFIWRCDVCDKDQMEKIFGNKWETSMFEDLEQGTRMRWIIKKTDDDEKNYSEETKENETVLRIVFNKWRWLSEDVWGNEDDEDEITHFKDPEDYPEDLIFANFAPFWLPLPFGEYLKEMDLYEGYTIDSRVLLSITCEIEKNDLEGDYPTEYIKILALYNEQGILKSYKLYIKDHQVIIDISLESFLNQDIYLLPAITATLYVGLIYIIYKKILKD